jgi:hypothetical protein
MLVERLDRNAAYISAREAVAKVRHATAAWPPDVARCANRAATDTVVALVEALRHEPTSPERRTRLRDAVVHVLELAGICDLAIAHGLRSEEIVESLRSASRTLSLLGMSFHATAAGSD